MVAVAMMELAMVVVVAVLLLLLLLASRGHFWRMQVKSLPKRREEEPELHPTFDLSSNHPLIITITILIVMRLIFLKKGLAAWQAFGR
jgi:hypothetical protein